MLRQKIVLSNGWTIYAYYAVDTYYTDEIMGHLYDIGCRGEDLHTAYENLSSGKLDTGLTYSNCEHRKTVLVVGITSSPDEFFNSWQHEVVHVRQHIARCTGMDVWGEEIAYLGGELSQKMFPVIRKFLLN